MFFREIHYLTVLLLFTSLNLLSQNKNYFESAIKHFNTEIDSSIFFLKKGIEHYKEVKDWNNYINCFNGLSSCYHLKGEYTKSNSYAIKANTEAKKYLSDTDEPYGISLHNLAIYSRSKGNFKEAIEYYTKTLNIEIRENAEKNQIITLNNIAFCYYESGEFTECKKFYLKSLAIAERISPLSDINRQRAIIGLAKLYKAQNNSLKALAIYKNVINQIKHNHAKEVSLYANFLTEIRKKIGIILLEENLKKDFDKNLQQLKSFHSIAFSKPSKDAFLLSAKWALKDNQFNKAIKDFKTALLIEKNSNTNIKSSTKIGEIYFNIGNTYLKKEEFLLALDNFDKALNNFKINRKPKEIDSLSEAVLNITALEILISKASTHYILFQKNNNLTELSNAEKTYTLAIQLLNKVRSSYRNRGSKENLLNVSTQIFEGILEIYHLKYQEDKSDKITSPVYEVFENSKAVILLESINSNIALGSAGIPDSLLHLEKHYSQNISFHKKNLALLESVDSTKKRTIENNLFDLEKSHQELINIFESDYPKYFDLKYNDNFNTIEDGKKLVANEKKALLNYFVGDEHIYILVITNSEIKFNRVPKSHNFNNQIEDLRKLISNPPAAQNSDLEFKKFQAASYDLYKLLIAPIGLSSPIDQLIIIPDDILAYLPFEILLTNQNASNKVNYKLNNLDYLMEDYQITYLYSTTLLNHSHNKKDKNRNGDIISFAPSFGNQTSKIDSSDCSLGSLSALACNSYEAESVVELFTGKTLIGAAASSQNFNEEVNNYRIVHFATHSCLNDENPMLNKIFFNDDYISNYDLYNLSLNNELVVLSACNTGSGTLRRGEGVMSLSRGFIHAGCPSVLMSLWSVEDCTTTDIMVNFYKELKQGKSKDLALQTAKLNYLNQANKLESHPFYWAPFVHIGNVEPLVFSSGIAYWIIGFIILASIIGLIAFQQKNIARK